CTDDSFVIERVSNTEAWCKVLVLRLDEVVIQAPAADRFSIGPTNVQALIRIRAVVALPDEVRPIRFGGIGRKDDLRYGHREVIADRIGKGRSEFPPESQR